MSETKLFTLSEVSQHKTCESLWIVIHNKVFDVTKFMDDHPGGEETLLEQGGLNATESFEDVGHSTDARELMSEYKIGELVESERTSYTKFDPNPDGEDDTKGSTLIQWIIPTIIALGVAFFYRYYIASPN